MSGSGLGTRLTIAFGTTTAQGQGVPDGGLTLSLLGFALVEVEGLRRKLGQ